MTPIMAAGSGIVEKAGPTSGYGNFTLIRHTNGYETGYGHQTPSPRVSFPRPRAAGADHRLCRLDRAFDRPASPLRDPRHGSPVDPLRIRLPRGRVLEGELLGGFERERERIDALLATPGATPAKVASASATNN